MFFCSCNCYPFRQGNQTAEYFLVSPKAHLDSQGSPHTRLRAMCCHNELTFLPELSKTCHHQAFSGSIPARHPWLPPEHHAPWGRPLLSSPRGQPPLSFQSLFFPSRAGEALLGARPCPSPCKAPCLGRDRDGLTGPAANCHLEDGRRATSFVNPLARVLPVVMIVSVVQTDKSKYREACSRSPVRGRWCWAEKPGAGAAELTFLTTAC